MKKALITTSILSVMIPSIACSGNITQDTQNTSKSTTAQSTEAPEITTETIATNEISLNETGNLSTWAITIEKISFKDKISDNEFTAFTPDSEGNKFLVIALKAENIGKEADQFLPSVSLSNDVNVKVLFGDGYEFSMTNLLGYEKNLVNSMINPLSSQNGEIFFEVPEKVYNSEEPLILNFSADQETLKNKIKIVRNKNGK